MYDNVVDWQMLLYAHAYTDIIPSTCMHDCKIHHIQFKTKIYFFVIISSDGGAGITYKKKSVTYSSEAKLAWTLYSTVHITKRANTFIQFPLYLQDC